jgi:small subunit ribosomal protein S13
MARIAGVDLPRNKQARIALTYIFGIGDPRALKILEKANVDPFKKVQDLGEDEVNRIRQVIEDEGNVEGDLRKDVSMHIKRLIDIQSYRGLRHRRSLPVAASAPTPTLAPARAPQGNRCRQEESDEIMAKTQNQQKPAGKPGKNKKFKKRERKNVPFGLVFIQATFNNTIVTITDQTATR